jgi:hypothetical protein
LQLNDQTDTSFRTRSTGLQSQKPAFADIDLDLHETFLGRDPSHSLRWNATAPKWNEKQNVKKNKN